MNENDLRTLRQQDKDPQFHKMPQSVVSATECTGLVQTPPESTEEAESLTKVYNARLCKKKTDRDLPS